MLEEIIKQHCDELSKKHGYMNDYDIIITSDMDLEDYITIKGGTTPIIYVNRFWILGMLVKSQEIELMSRKKLVFIPLTSALNRALEKVPKMTRSLSLLTVKEAITLRKDAKRWALGVVPQIKTHMRDKYFKISYNISVTISEETSNTSITRNNITNLDELDEKIDSAKLQISRSISNSEEMDLIRDFQESKDSLVREVKPYTITITEHDGELKEKYVY